MLYRFIYTLAVFFAVSIITSRLKAQVQYDVIQTPVCWHTGSVDSSIVKFSIVTTSGAYLDLGFFDVSGTPVTVTGGTTETGFCGDSLTIDSSGFVYTLNLGNQSVNFRKGAEKIDDLLDASYDDIRGNVIIGDTTKIPFLTAPKNTANIGMGRQLFRGFNFGLENLLIGTRPMYEADSSSRNASIGKNTGGGHGKEIGLPYANKHNFSTFLGQFAGGLDSLTYKTVIIGEEANMPPTASFPGQTINGVLIGGLGQMGTKNSQHEIAIGAHVVGKGDSTVTLGLPFYKGTYLNGNLNLNGYGLGNKEAADIGKTASAYIAGYATDGTLIEVTPTTGATALDELTDVTISSPQINDILKYNGTAWVNDTLTISGGGVLSVSANNGLSNSGTATQPVIELGGTLTKDTEIQGDQNDLTFDSLLYFKITNTPFINLTPTPVNTTNELALTSLTYALTSENNTSGQVNTISLNATGTSGAELRSELGSDRTSIEVLPTVISIATPAIYGTTATNGQVLKLVDANTGEVEFADDETGTITASNGLTKTGDDIQLGGTLIQATTIEGARENLTIDSLGLFRLTDANSIRLSTKADATTYENLYLAGGFGATHFMSHSNSANNQYNVMAVGGDGVRLSSDRGGTPISFSVDYDNIYMKTPGTIAGTSTAGQFLKLVNAGTGLVEFDTIPTSTEVDGSVTNEIQDLSLTGNTLSLSGDATTVDLSPYLDDQTVTLTGGGITAVSGAYPSFTITSTEVDGSVTNEIQDLSLTGNTLSLSGDATTVDLSPYLDDQTVTLTGGGITAISGTYPNFTITSTEVDGSVSNEGSLTVGAGTSTTSIISSNTSGSTDVTIEAGTGLSISESGNTITITPSAYPIGSGASASIDWGSTPQKIHVLDFGFNTSLTLSFSNVLVGGIYTLRVTGNAGTDTLIWPSAAKFEDGSSVGTVTLQDGGQMFTFYWDGTNYWVK